MTQSLKCFQEKEKTFYGVRHHKNYEFINWSLINLWIHNLYHLTHKALFLLFLRAFPTLLVCSWLTPKNGSTESKDTSEKSLIPISHHSQCMAPSMYNAYILFSPDYATNSRTIGNTGRINQTDFEHHSQQAPCGVNQMDTLTWLSSNKQLL